MVSPPPTKSEYLDALKALYPASPEGFASDLLGDCGTIQYSRPLSWDLCYQHFKSETEYFSTPIPADKLDRAALELSNYLASFGMFRSTEMKAVNRRVFEPIISALFHAAQRTGIRSYQDLDCITPTQLRALINALDKAYVDAFLAAGFVDHHPSDTMTSKILMGVFGVMPALDDNYITAVRKLHRQLRKTYSLPRQKRFTQCLPTTLHDNEKLKFLLDLSRDKDLKVFLKELVLPVINHSDNRTNDDYPVMRLLDLYLWVIGKKVD